MKATWVLVCDAGRARIFSYEKRADPWDLVDEIENPAGRARAHDLVSDKPGQVRQSGHGEARPGMEPQTDPADVESERFAHRLGKVLESGFDDHRFGRLVLVAPPRFLGQLRKSISTPVQRSIEKSIDKDLSRLDAREIEQRVGEALS